MKNLSLVCLLLLTFSFGLFAQEKDKIFIGKDPFKLVFGKAVGHFLEGGAMSPDKMVYVSDMALSNNNGIIGSIWRFDPKTGKTEVYRSPAGGSTGLHFDKYGRLVVCEGALESSNRITRTDLRTGISQVLTSEFNGKGYNAPNDLVIDKNGNIFFTDPKYLGTEPMAQPVHGVYKIDATGNVSLVIAFLQKPNGIVLSPDQKTLYITVSNNFSNGNITHKYKGPRENWTSKLMAFSIENDSTISFKKELADLKTGLGDGMTVDTEGNIYVALFYGKKIVVFSPEGKQLEELIFPGFISNVTFGREEYKNTLFVTGQNGLYEVETTKEGFHIPFEEPSPLPSFTAITLDSDELESFIGEYQDEKDLPILVFNEGGQLFIQPQGHSKVEIFPYSPNNFFAKVTNLEIKFKKQNNKVSGFTMVGKYGSFKYSKKKSENPVE